MLGFLISIFNLLWGIFETIDTYRSIAFAYLVHFVNGIIQVVIFAHDFVSFVPAPLQALGGTFFCIAVARVCISLGGH